MTAIDPVGTALLRLIAEALTEEVGPDTFFAAFIDWRDDRPVSYLSNGERADIVAALAEWLGKTSRREPTLAEERGEVPALEARCARIGREVIEDVDVVLFLFTNPPGGETAWFSSLPGGRALVERWVAAERGRS